LILQDFAYQKTGLAHSPNISMPYATFQRLRPRPTSKAGSALSTRLPTMPSSVTSWLHSDPSYQKRSTHSCEPMNWTKLSAHPKTPSWMQYNMVSQYLTRSVRLAIQHGISIFDPKRKTCLGPGWCRKGIGYYL